MESPGIRACRKMMVHTNKTAGHAGGAQIPKGNRVYEVRLEAAPPEEERVIDKRRRVLVVDEDAGHCKVVSKFLAKDFADLHVDVAHDAEAALQLLVDSVSSPASESSCADDYDLVLITGPEISGRPIVDLVYRVRSFCQVRRRAWGSRQEVEFVAVVKTAEEVTALEELAWHEVGREGQNVMMKPIKREPLRALVSQVLLHRERSDDNSNDNMLMVSRQSPPRASKRPTPSGRRAPLDSTGI